MSHKVHVGLEIRERRRETEAGKREEERETMRERERRPPRVDRKGPV